MGLFGDLGLKQCVRCPTHRKGNILDLLLTGAPQTIQNLSVLDDSSLCASDHYPIYFEIKANVRRKHGCKRIIQNFKKADWNSLNIDLNEINWHMILSSHDIEVCWSNFVREVNQCCDRHIPKVTIKDGFQPPWFDLILILTSLTNVGKKREYASI